MLQSFFSIPPLRGTNPGWRSLTSRQTRAIPMSGYFAKSNYQRPMHIGNRNSIPSTARESRPRGVCAAFHVSTQGNRLLLSCAALVLALGEISCGFAAEAAYPQRPIRFLLPQSPGGASYTVGANVARKDGSKVRIT